MEFGLGYGRAQDVASDGAWLEKAAQIDLVSVCFGVNDILQGRNQTQICQDLLKIVQLLTHFGCDVGIFTLPPFNWTGENGKTWRAVNQYLTTELAKQTAFVFDTVPALGQGCG